MVCKTAVPGSIPGRLSVSIRLPCPHLARWPRQPDSHSGNAGSNPAGDTGLIRRPVCFFGGPRLGGRACQRSVTLLAPDSRAARFAGPLVPAEILRANFRMVLALSSGRHDDARELRRAPHLCSLCPGGRASGYELDWRGSTPRREANSSAPRSHARRPAPVLVARDTSLRSLLPRFDSWQGRRRKGRSQPRLIISTLPVQFRLLHPRRLEASGGSHKAVRGGSTPLVATKNPHFRGDSRLIWVWLNLAELRFRAPAIGGSNPLTQTILAVQIHLGVAQSGQSTGSGNRGLEVRILSPRPRGTSKLVNAPVPQTGLAGFDPLVPHRKGFCRGRTVR